MSTRCILPVEWLSENLHTRAFSVGSGLYLYHRQMKDDRNGAHCAKNHLQTQDHTLVISGRVGPEIRRVIWE